MIEIEDMRCFVEVVENGGFNRAARRLGISKSVVSRRIARIEADLGTVLLTRTTRVVRPTEAGLEFKERSARIVAEFDEAREAIARQSGTAVGRLRISAPLAFGVRHLAPVLGELAREHPRLEIDASFDDRVRDLLAEGFDAAIRIGELKDSSLVARRLSEGRSLLVASPDYLERRGRPEKPADLAGHEALIYTGRASSDWRLKVGNRWVSIHQTGRLRSDSGDTLVSWAIAGLGIAEIPAFLLSDAIDSGALVPVLLEYPTAPHGIYVVRPPGSPVPGKVRVLIDTLVHHFGGEPYWDRCLMHERHGTGTLPHPEPLAAE